MKVIVTDAALRTALYVIRSLGRNNVEVTATEYGMGALANPGFASRYVSRRAQVPSVIYDEDRYVEELLKLCRGHDVLLPVSMYSIKAVSKHLDKFTKLVKVPIADYDKLIKVNSTDSAIKAAMACGVPVPKTWFIDDLKQLDDFSKEFEYPLFIKVKDEMELSPGQRHTAAYSREDFIRKYYSLHSFQPFPLVQEFIRGDGAGFFTLFDRDSRPMAVFGHRRIREYPLNGGPSTCCESYYNAEMFEYGARLLKNLNWYGLAMVEFKIDRRDGKPKFMEINPRVWGSMPLAVESGVDFPYLWLKTALGEEYAPITDFRRGVKVRFFFNDLRAAAASLFKRRHFRRYFLGFLKDLFDLKIKDGIFTLSDVLPGLVYVSKTFLIFAGYFKPKNTEIRLDVHIHSKYSYDSLSEPRDIVNAARAAGLRVIAVTDHDTIRGAVEAKKFETDDLRVIIGEEISTDRGDVIGLFLKEEIKERDFAMAIEAVRRQGGIAVLAHPYKRTVAIAEDVIGRLDAVEAFNSRAESGGSSKNNEKASDLARSRGLPELAGSDAHFLFEIGRAYGVVRSPGPDAIKEAILSGRVSTRGRTSSPFLDLLSQAIKMFKLKRPGMLLKVPGKLYRYMAGRPAPESADYKSILIVLVAGIGDFFESIPALKSVRDSYPNAGIFLLVSSKVYDYARQCPYVNNVYSFPVSGGRGFSAGSIEVIRHYIELVKVLRGKNLDVALNLYGVSSWAGAVRMALLIKASGVRTTFGRNTDGKGFFFSRKIEENETDKHHQAYYFNSLAGLVTGGKKVEKALPWITGGDDKSAVDLMSELGLTPSDRIMLINPGSDRLTRRWLPENFAKVIDYFADNYQLKPVFIGNASEVPVTEDIARLTKAKTFSTAGKLSIGGLAALVRRSDILFTTNSAAMHIAGLFGLPFVAVAGSGNPFKDRPDGDERKMSLLWKKYDCNPCDNWKCPKKRYMECMRMITADEVIAEGRRMLDGSGA